MYNLLAGYFCAIGGCVLGGTWQALVKSDKLSKHTIHPALQQASIGLGFFCISWVALARDGDGGETYVFTPWGLLSGWLSMSAMFLNLTTAFPILGIAVAAGIAASFTIPTGMVAAVGIFDEAIDNTWLTVTGILLTIVGLAGLAYVGHTYGTVRAEEPGSSGADGGGSADGGMPNPQDMDDNEESALLRSGAAQPKPTMSGGGGGGGGAEAGKPRYWVGALASATVGIFGGVTLVPNLSCCADDGTMFFPSMGVGVLCSAALYASIMVLLYPATDDVPLVPSREVLVATIPIFFVGGVFQASGILLTIKAIALIDYVVAVTLSQMSILVTGMWGLILYKEIEGITGIAIFFASAGVLIGGAALVAAYGVG